MMSEGLITTLHIFNILQLKLYLISKLAVVMYRKNELFILISRSIVLYTKPEARATYLPTYPWRSKGFFRVGWIR